VTSGLDTLTSHEPQLGLLLGRDGASTHRQWGKETHRAGHELLRPPPDRPGDRWPDSPVELRRGQETRDHQLPHPQAGARRSVLREDLRAHQGLGVLLRQVQTRALQGHHLW